MKKSSKRWLTEGKDHVRGKEIIRAVAKKYGCGVVEEERFPVDLHVIYPTLWPHKSIRGYQADLLITKRRGKDLYRVIAEVDGEIHEDDPIRKLKDTIRDVAIPNMYGLKVIRFTKSKLLKGEYSEEEIAGMLGLI